jgi:hypothetical protein
MNIIYFFSSNKAMNITTDMTTTRCDLNSNASIMWQKYFREIHPGMNHFTIRCLFSELIPTGAVILFNSCIIYYLVRAYRHLHQTNHCIKQSRTASWMNIVLILHSLLFLTPFLSHATGHYMRIEPHETWWVTLAVLINYSLNFYIYCLSSTAFRREIHRFTRRVTGKLFF